MILSKCTNSPTLTYVNTIRDIVVYVNSTSSSGNLIDLEPMTLVYVQMGATFICLILFSVGAVMGRNIVKKDKVAAEWEATAAHGNDEELRKLKE